MTRFELRTSRELLILQITITSIVIVLMFSQYVLLLKWFIFLVIIAFFFWFAFRRIRRKYRTQAVCAIQHSESGWQLSFTDQHVINVELKAGCVATPVFLVLNWHEKDGAKKGQSVIWRDALDDVDYRHLCRLYWSEKI